MNRRLFLSLAAASLTLITPATTQADETKGTITIVLTNHGKMGDTDTATGFFLSEAAHPYKVFTDAGYTVTLTSPLGGFAPLDPKSKDLDDPANKVFWDKFGTTVEGRDGIDTKPLVANKEVAIFFAGGHGTMWDFPNSKFIQNNAELVYKNGGVIGGVCHGPAALIGIKNPTTGEPIVKGKTLAVFTDNEEAAVKLTDIVPFLLQTELEKLGATVKTAPNFTENAIRDGRLVTGQNPASATKAAQLVIEALSE